jgi:hypothetical protein
MPWTFESSRSSTVPPLTWEILAACDDMVIRSAGGQRILVLTQQVAYKKLRGRTTTRWAGQQWDRFPMTTCIRRQTMLKMEG